LKLPGNSGDLLSRQAIKKKISRKEVAMSYSIKIKFLSFVLFIVLAAGGFLLLRPLRAQAKGSNPPDVMNTITLTSPSRVQQASTGLISGELSFPSERIPALTIFAIRIDNDLLFDPN
jgi:hypothetical protein